MSSVATTHPEYDEYLPLWQKVRTVVGGEEKVKEAGTLFLPQLTGQESGEYGSYKARAMFYGASARTVQGLTGAIFRKPPEVLFPKSKLEFLEHIGSARESLEDISKALIEEIVSVGRAAILVDAPNFEDSEPFLALYWAESIINWLSRRGPTGEETVEVVLVEERQGRSADDPYVTETTTFYRVLRLGVPPGEQSPALAVALEKGPVYYQELYREEKEVVDGKEETRFVLVDVVVPQMRGGKFLYAIPCFIVNASKIGLKPENPPLLPLVNVNLSHYRNSADLEHGRHFTALPTAWVAGFDPKTILMIGSSVAWVTENVQARAGFLEFTGAGLGHLQEGMRSKERLMSVLGARMLEELPTDGTEAAETVKLRQSGEASTLAGISQICSSALTKALRIIADWIGISSDEKVSILLNRDFQTAALPPNTLQNLIAAAQAGLISWSTFFGNLKRGELIPDHVDEAEELREIKKGLPIPVEVPPVASSEAA